ALNSGRVCLGIDHPFRATPLPARRLWAKLFCKSFLELGGEGAEVRSAEAARVVERDTLSVAGCFADSDGIPNDGVEDRIPQGLVHAGDDLGRVDGATAYLRRQYAKKANVRLQQCLNALQKLEEPREGSEAHELGLNGNDEEVRGYQCTH